MKAAMGCTGSLSCQMLLRDPEITVCLAILCRPLYHAVLFPKAQWTALRHTLAAYSQRCDIQA